jgi:hypothetical protein
LLDFFAAGALVAAAGTTRSGFFPLVAAGFALILFLSASIKSITGARVGCTVAVTSWPLCFAAIIAYMLS